jgi:hypothetical protein
MIRNGVKEKEQINNKNKFNSLEGRDLPLGSDLQMQ